MKIDYVYAAVSSRDLEKSEEFYSKVLGRKPDDRPMKSLIQWRDIAGAGVQVFLDSKKAGNGAMTLVVPSAARIKGSLESAGYECGEVQEGDFGKIVQVNDPDSNVVTFPEPPKQA